VDLNGALVAPTGVLNATSWKGPAILPRGNHPRSPPFFPDGHSEYSWAICSTKIVYLMVSELMENQKMLFKQIAHD
jgi:hypothetical protein